MYKPPFVDYYLEDFGGGGGGSTDTKQKSKSLILKLCQKLKLPYYGFLLYHSGHYNLKAFLDDHLDFLDRVSGNCLIFTLIEKRPQQLKIDELIKINLDSDIIKEGFKTLQSGNIPFSANKCFEIADALGIKRKELPCLLLYRTANGYRSFAKIALKDSWFPSTRTDKEMINNTMEWNKRLFDSIDECIRIKDKKKAIITLQKKCNKISRIQNQYKPIFIYIQKNISPIFNLPFKIVASLNTIIENVGTKMIKKKIESLTD